MKRFTIKNQKVGLEFVVEGETMGPVLPEYGKPERWVREEDEDISGALETREISGTLGVTYLEYRLPAEFTVTEEDVTAEVDHFTKKMTRISEREFCYSVIDEIGIMNVELGIQPSTLFQNPSFQGIIMALLTGAPKTARDVIAATGATVYPQEKVDYIVNMITAKVGA